MSTSQLSVAHSIWRRRRERTREDKIYALYASFLVGVIIILPVVRALWVVASSPSGLAVLTSADAPVAVSIYVAALWAGGLLVGTKCGPALLPPFLLHTLTASGIRRALALRRPVLSSMVIVVFACAAGAVLAGTALLNDSQAQLWGALVFVGAVIATGVVTTVLWLTGQVFPRAALPIALTVLVLGGVCLHMPQVLAFAPWGWVGAAYPSVGSDVLPLAGTTVLAAVSIVMIPVLLDRLTGMQLGQQAAQLERATTFSFSFDICAATAVYEAAPQLGRNFCAIRPCMHRWVTFFIRDVVGQARTPVRSLGAVAAVTVAGILLSLSFVSGALSAVLAGTAGIVLYGATGPLTKGLQHAASIAGDYPLYGISDRHLVLLHSLFPLMATQVILFIAATATALATGTTFGVALIGSCAVGILTLVLRLGSSLKGPLPPSLLTPANTPAGDLSIVMQIGWAVSDPLIAVLGALTITMVPATPIPLALLTTWTGLLVLARWKKRR